jgi:predicted site-specific integrase-resolvase
MADEDSQAEDESNESEDERVVVAARVSKEKKQRIESQLSYGDHIQDWLEDAIDQKLAAAEEGEGEGNAKVAAKTAD